MAELIQVLRTVVNTWECDEMGHLNVRYYPARESEAVRMLLARCGATPEALRARGLRVRWLEKHIRFHREMRPGTAFTGWAGFVAVHEDRLETYCELRHARDGVVAATVVGQLALCRAGTSSPVPIEAPLREAATEHIVPIPAHGAPRGVPAVPPRPAPKLTQAVEIGMAGAYLGLTDAQHVDADGFVEPAGHIARVSDGIQHLFLAFSDGRPRGLGGAVLEFRFVHRKEARPGDPLEIRSGLKGVAEKTRHFCHWMFDGVSGECVATAEAVAVSFDLEARKAVALGEQELARARKHVVPGISC